MKKCRKQTHSMHTRMWAYFLVLALLIMAMIWCLQIAFLNTYYSVMKSRQISIYGNEIFAEFKPENGVDDDFREKLYSFCFEKGISARIFSEDGALVYSPEMYMFSDFNVNFKNFNDPAPDTEQGRNRSRRPMDGFMANHDEIIKEFENGKTVVIKNGENAYTHSTYIVYARIMTDSADNDYYLTITSILAPVDATSKVLQNQLMLITVISLLIAFLLSFFFAKQLVKPIVKITDASKQLATGDYSVEFEGSTYTEINELSKALNNAAHELSKTDRLRRDLIANVSHDLRTPMTIIKSYAEMIRDLSGNNPEKRAAHTQVIIDEADRLTTLVNDILDLSKLESGTAKIVFEEFNLSREVSEIVNRFTVFTETQGYNFVTHIEENLFVIGDEHSIVQVIYNLISNAINYTGDDKRVEITLKKAGKNARFEVRDTGEGISENDRSLIWDRYYRASELHKRTKLGTGVGLSIVKNILENHKAPYGVDTALGKGSVFWFELPLSDDNTEE